VNRLKTAIVLGFTLMFIAGMAIGEFRKPAPRRSSSRSWLSDQLELTSEQQQRMRDIWSAAAESAPRSRFREIDRQRDTAIDQLLSDEQKRTYAGILHDHDAQVAALRALHDQAVRDAEEKTRAILTTPQRQKFDEITRQHGHRFPAPINMARRRPPSNPTTRPQ
jgi:Spy/CpxP family protein refolding chaperone